MIEVNKNHESLDLSYNLLKTVSTDLKCKIFKALAYRQHWNNRRLMDEPVKHFELLFITVSNVLKN